MEAQTFAPPGRTCSCGCGRPVRSRYGEFAPGCNLRVARLPGRPRGAAAVRDRNLCACGCGLTVLTPGATYALGHHQRSPEWKAKKAANDRRVALSRSTADPARPLAVEVEGRRLRDQLTRHEVAAAIGISLTTYDTLVHGKREQLEHSTAGRVARWLGMSAETLLRWEGCWEELSPIGRVLLPAMVDRGLSQTQLAIATGTSVRTVRDGLHGSATPKGILQRWAAALGAADVDLLRARKVLLEERPPRPTSALIRRMRRRSSDALVIQGRLLGESYVRKTSAEQRREASQHAALAIRERWATITPRELLRWSRLHLSPRPAGHFDTCRICGKLVYAPPSAIAKRGREPEYHRRCLATWQAQSPAFRAWARMRALGRTAGPLPTPPRPAGRRTLPAELADCYAAAVRYLQLKELNEGQKILPRRAVEELAEAFGITPRGLMARVQRLVELLPAPEICDKSFAHRVRVLEALRP